MPIDIRSEELFTLKQVAESLPGRPARSTVWRWCRTGIRGVRLTSVVIGAKRYTSFRALAEFSAALTAASEPANTTDAAAVTSPERDPSTALKLKAAKLLQ